MKGLLRWINTHTTWLLVALVVILMNVAVYFSNYSLISYIFYFFIGILLLYYLFFDKKKLIFLTIFLIPLSITIKLGSGNALSFPSEALIAILGLFSLISVLRKKTIERLLLYHPLTILILLDLVWMFVCCFYSSIPEFSFKRLLVRLLFVAIFYFLAFELFKNKRNMWMLTIIYAIGIIYPVLNSMINHSKFGFAARGSYQMTLPFFADHTLYGACLAILVPVLFSIAVNRKLFEIKKKYRSLLWILAGFILVAAILSYSRAAWLGLVVALILSILILFRTRFYVIMIALAVIVAVSIYNFGEINDWAKRSDAKSNSTNFTEHVESVSNIQNDASNTERINRWKCAYRMFQDRPVVGFGPGTYQYNYGKYQIRSEMTHISTYTGNRGHAHSEYFTYLSEEGLPGLLIFLLLVYYSVYLGLKIVYSSTDLFSKRLALAVLLGLVTYYVHGVFNAFLDMDKMAMPVLTSLAILVSLDRKPNANPQTHEPVNQNQVLE